MGSVTQLIRQWAPRFGLDPRAVMAISMHEGGLRRNAVGDHGTSFGPFQMHEGGALPSGKGAAWAGSDAGIIYALRQMGSVAGGLTGQAAVANISRRFERPADPNAEIADAMHYYGGHFNPNAGGPAPAGGGGGGGGNYSFSPQSGGGGGPNGQKQFAQMMAMNMLQQAGNTVNGLQSDPGSLMQLAMMRQQMGAAQAANGPAYNPNASVSPTHQGGWSGKVLNGNASMLTGGRSPYSNLRFAAGVDWRHVNPRLLKTINSVAASHGGVVEVNSGYRSNAHSAAVGGFAGDPHSKGIAVDAYVNGKPIGDVYGAALWGRYGIKSGAVPNFYKGAPDPEHLQL